MLGRSHCIGVLSPLRRGYNAPRSPKEKDMSEGKQQRETMAPGDKAQPGAENAGEDLCPECDGTGRKQDEECKNCSGSGTIWVPVGTP